MLSIALGTIKDAGEIVICVLGLALIFGKFSFMANSLENIVIIAWAISAFVNTFKGYSTFKGLLGK